MAEQLADHSERYTPPQRERRIGMSQIVETNVVQPGAPSAMPNSRKVHVWAAAPPAGNDIGANARDVAQYLNRGITEIDGFRLVSLAIWQANQAPFPIN